MQSVLVQHLMTRKVVTFFPEQSLALAEEVMQLHRFRHLPVVNAQRQLLGLVTDRDILAAKVSSIRELAETTRATLDSAVVIRDIMTVDLWSVRPTAKATAAGQMLLDHRFSCLPVTEEDNTLVGILTVRDYLRFAVKLVAQHDDP